MTPLEPVEVAVTLAATIAVAVLPGLGWAFLLVPTRRLPERVAFAVGLSVSLVPPVALLAGELTGGGIGAPAAGMAVVLVGATGLLLCWLRGLPRPHDRPGPFPPLVFSDPAMVGIAGLVILILLVEVGPLPSAALAPPAAALALLVGLGARIEPRPADGERREEGRNPSALLLLPVLALVTARSYAGPVLFDWPLIRGMDQYIHVILSRSLGPEASGEGLLVYPPAFHALTATVTALTGSDALTVYAVAAPLLVPAVALASYVCARRFLGPWPALMAAALIGLLVRSPMRYLNDGSYVQLLASGFLLVLAFTAFGILVARPAPRVVGLSVVLCAAIVAHHTISTLYLAVLLVPVPVAVFGLWRASRRRALHLAAAAGVFVLLGAMLGWWLYSLDETVSGLLSGTATRTGSLIGEILGTQDPPDPLQLPRYVEELPVYVGLIGVVAMLSHLGDLRPSLRLGVVALCAWLALFWLASGTSLSAVPFRFARDLGTPLSIAGGLALTAIVRTGFSRRRGVLPASRMVPAIAVLALATLLAGQALVAATRPSRLIPLSHDWLTAAAWLRDHREPGVIVASPYVNAALLATTGYDGLLIAPRQDRRGRPNQSSADRAARWIISHPAGSRTANLLERRRVRFIALMKSHPERPPGVYGLYREPLTQEEFRALPARYEVVFENDEAVVFRIRPMPTS